MCASSTHGGGVSLPRRTASAEPFQQVTCRPLRAPAVVIRMLRTLLACTLLVFASASFVPGASAWTCTSAMDGAAVEVSLPFNTYYERVVRSGGFYVQEMWQEVNGETGLQNSAGMSCSGKADRLLARVCVGLCPIQM